MYEKLRSLITSTECRIDTPIVTQLHTDLEGSVNKNPFSEKRPRTSLATNHTKHAGEWAWIDTLNSVLVIRETLTTWKMNTNSPLKKRRRSLVTKQN